MEHSPFVDEWPWWMNCWAWPRHHGYARLPEGILSNVFLGIIWSGRWYWDFEMALCEFQFLGFSTTKDGLKKAARRGNFRKKSGFRQQEHRARKSGKNWTRHGDAHPQTVGIMLIPIWSNLDIFNGHDWSVTNGWCSTTLIWSILWADHRFFRSIFIWDRLGLVGTFKIFGINKNLKSQNQSRWVPGHPQC